MSAEKCDGKDNDCDGRVDEDVLNACKGCARLDHTPGQSCSEGMGDCAGTGVYECMGTEVVSCNARARTPTREVCDGVDNDCNGMIDDGVGKTWYQDCDADGYAAAGTGQEACSKPSNSGGCAWTDRAPTASTTDCDDRNEARHPGADFGLPISRTGQSLPSAGDQSYDLNCDGVLTTGSAATLSTGLVKLGKLETIGLCGSTTGCSGGGPVCAMSFPVPGGGAVCGQAYTTQPGCGSGDINVYFLCR
jgi:hypothetical protein